MQLCRTCTEPQSSAQNDLFPIFFYFSCSKIRVVCFWQAAVVLTLQWGCLKRVKRTWKVYFKRTSPGLWTAQITPVKWTIHIWVKCGCQGAVFAKIKYGNADFCRQNINLYSSSASAAQLFFLHNLSLLWLLFAFLWYIDICPWPAHLMHCAEEGRLFCRVKKVTWAPEIKNRKSQTIRSWLNFNSIVCSHEEM